MDLYIAFIEVPYTQGAQVRSVRITQCYLQITPYLPLPRKHSPDGASQTEVARTSNCSLLLIYLPRKDERLSWPGRLVTVMRQFTCPKAITHPSTNRARCRATALIETNALPLHQTANQITISRYWRVFLLSCSQCLCCLFFGLALRVEWRAVLVELAQSKRCTQLFVACLAGCCYLMRLLRSVKQTPQLDKLPVLFLLTKMKIFMNENV